MSTFTLSRYQIILISLVLLGFLLRFIGLEQSPPYLYWDEASIGYEAFSLSQTGRDMHGNSWLQAIFPAYGDYKAPVYLWFTSLAVKLLRVSMTSIRITSVLAGTLTILASYHIAHLLTKSKKIALLSSLMLAVLPWHIHFSRAGFESNLGVMFLAFAILFELKGKEKGYFLVVSALIGTLSIYSYFSMRIVLPFIALCVLVAYWGEFKHKLVWIIVGMSVYLLGSLPLVLSPYFEAANQYRLSTASILNTSDSILYSNNLRTQDNFGLISRLIHHRYLYLLKEFLVNMSDHISFDYLFLTGDPNPRHSTQVTGIMLPVMAPLLLAGLYFGFEKHRKTLVFLLLWWGASLVPASIPLETPHALRSLTAAPALSILLSIGTYYVWKFLLQVKFGKIIIWVYVILFIVNFLTFYQYQLVHYPKLTASDWQAGYKPVVDYIIANQNQYEHIIVDDIDRLYLYYLLFSHYPPYEVHSMSQQQRQQEPSNYQIKKIGKVSFQTVILNEVETMKKPALIITRSRVPQNFAQIDVISTFENEPIQVYKLADN